MNAAVTSTAHPLTSRLSLKNHVGLVLATLLGLSDLVDVVALSGTASGSAQIGPPTSILAVDALLGLVTLVGVALAWARRSRVALRVCAVSRILSAVTALPAFFAGGVPAALVVEASSLVVVAAVAAWLLLARGRPA